MKKATVTPPCWLQPAGGRLVAPCRLVFREDFLAIHKHCFVCLFCVSFVYQVLWWCGDDGRLPKHQNLNSLRLWKAQTGNEALVACFFSWICLSETEHWKPDFFAVLLIARDLTDAHTNSHNAAFSAVCGGRSNLPAMNFALNYPRSIAPRQEPPCLSLPFFLLLRVSALCSFLPSTFKLSEEFGSKWVQTFLQSQREAGCVSGWTSAPNVNSTGLILQDRTIKD